MIVVPIVIAAISKAPPTTSQRIGPLRTDVVRLKEASFAVMELVAAGAGMPESSFAPALQIATVPGWK